MLQGAQVKKRLFFSFFSGEKFLILNVTVSFMILNNKAKNLKNWIYGADKV